eukprot:Phypoly_transcript_17009.p1 GENE.Phypoly_transcript_17009~~Phypoly_transcript_17009.p1  ORF type:complete len:200 (+),score=45.47 Phypoly_transcript_17009:51-602(+)
MADFRSRWEGYFKALDGNSNGFLEPSDALICAENLAKGLKFTAAGAEALKQAQIRTYSEWVKAADKNKDGKVSLPEFLEYAEKHFAGKKYEEIPSFFRDDLEGQAQHFDANGDGIITLDEWKAMNSSYPNHAPEAEFVAAFHRFAGGDKLDLAKLKHGIYEWTSTKGPVPDLEILFPFFKRQW